MAEATEDQLRDLVSGLDEVSADTIAIYLSFAKNTVIERGYGTSHARFGELQLYKCADLMARENIGNSNIESERVADVSISYGKNKGQLGTKYANNWESLYENTLTALEGMTSRCL